MQWLNLQKVENQLSDIQYMIRLAESLITLRLLSQFLANTVLGGLNFHYVQWKSTNSNLGFTWVQASWSVE